MLTAATVKISSRGI